MLLLARDEHEYRLLLVEVKTGSNNAGSRRSRTFGS